MSKILSVDEAAVCLRLTPTTVRRMIRDGELRALKVGNKYRIREEDIDDLWHAERIAAEAPPLTPEQRLHLRTLLEN